MIITLLYADIFNYPLTAIEVHEQLVGEKVALSTVESTLAALEEENFIYQHEQFYSPQTGNTQYVSRIKRNNLAKRYVKKGKRISRFIARFPFVKAVFLSGSLSKDCMDEDGDIDYFVITSANRLWIARTLLILFKKLALLNSYKYFCLNYFVDEEQLTIKEQNLFTATEIVTLIPTYGSEVCDRFIQANEWIVDYRPNAVPRSTNGLKNLRFTPFKFLLEKGLSGRAGEWLDNRFLKITEKYWKKKFNNYGNEDFNRSIKSRKHLSQINPENFQKRVNLALEEKIKAYENQHSVKLK